MTTQKPDDLEAVRQIAAMLEPFPSPDRERILRWARERLDMEPAVQTPQPHIPIQPRAITPRVETPGGKAADIRTFIDAKKPRSDIHFATVVAYYYRFEAPPDERRDSVTADVLIDACRKANRKRPPKPHDTLINAAKAGYLDATGEKGQYRINSVGENLVAMVLSDGEGQRPKPRKKRKTRKEGPKKTKK
jgi:hypothetical protein